MRITNKIMQNNNLTNINSNKVLQDKLSTQMSTQKKITKPSDDPVVAIRALRLRSNVTEASQYYSKNIPDATSWLEVTEGALKNTSSIITSMISQCTKGSNGDLTSSDREIILEQLKALKQEVYSTADVDYAGRYVFAGYRTDTSISFSKEDKTSYTITQQLDQTSIDETTFVKTTAEPVAGSFVDINDIISSNYNAIQVAENDISSIDVHRIRASYAYLSTGMVPTFTRVTGKDADGNITTENVVDPSKVITSHSYDIPSAYELASNHPDNVYFIPETGEMILGDNVYSTMMSYQDNVSTSTVNEGEIRITYQKNEWKKGDLRPEHYYACTSTDTEGNTLSYNQDYLTGSDVAKQVIEYDVGFNQKIQVNTTANECYDPGIGREIDDLVNILEDVKKLESVTGNLSSMLKTETDATKATTLQSRFNAANKALTLAKNKMQKMFEGSITSMQGYLDANNLSLTNCGTKSSKLELIEIRMKNQKTTFETLKSQNEDADITEVAIELKSAGLTYEAALMATGKVVKTSLLNFL
ncbi:MAG TPA: flagellar hook-associated protein FlgL [Lachnospiraceae bacterium]|nr:flagellar hook-associated protein FlgL [Lachnospiraceae bacterium]